MKRLSKQALEYFRKQGARGGKTGWRNNRELRLKQLAEARKARKKPSEGWLTA